MATRSSFTGSLSSITNDYRLFMVSHLIITTLGLCVQLKLLFDLLLPGMQQIDNKNEPTDCDSFNSWPSLTRIGFEIMMVLTLKLHSV